VISGESFVNNKTKLGLGAALAGAFALGATVVFTVSGAQQSPAGGAGAQAVSGPASPTPVETSFSDEQEEDIRALVHDYLMSNPEVIIDAVNEYSRQQQANAQVRARETAKERLAALVDPKHGFVAGKNPDAAKIAVIELFDYHCGYCKRAAPLVKSLIEDERDVKVVFREFPILREESDYAAEVALAAREQGKFLDMHFAMMEAPGVLTKDRIASIAKKKGLNVKKLEADSQNAAVSEAIVETVEIARAMGVDGTPAFVVASLDGGYVEVVQGFNADALKASIEEARTATR
jgi:protein-disulfide isomerase